MLHAPLATKVICKVLASGDDLSFPAFLCCRGHITGPGLRYRYP